MSDGIKKEGAAVENAMAKIGGTIKDKVWMVVRRMAAGAALANLARQAYAFANAFDNSMREVATLSKEISGNLDGYKDKILELTRSLPMSATAASSALYQIVSAGHDGAKGLQILEVSARAATGGITSTMTAADGITSILNSYGLTAADAATVSDQMFTTVKLGKTTFGELAASLSQVIPQAASFGISSKEVLAAIASITKSGTPTAQAMTQLRAAIQGCTREFGDSAFEGRTLQATLQALYEKAGGSATEIKKMAGTDEALGAILKVTGDNAKMAAADLAAMEQSAGAAEAAFQTMVGTTDNQSKLLRNRIMEKFHDIGLVIKESLSEATVWLGKAFESGGIEEAASAVVALTLAVGGYKATMAVAGVVQKHNNALIKEYGRIQRENAKAGAIMSKAMALEAAKTNILNANKKNLLRTMKSLRAAIAPTPWGIAAAAIGAVAGIVYKLATAESEAEKAAKRMAEATEDASKAAQAEISQLDALRDELDRCERGTAQWNEVRDKLVANFGQYDGNLASELERTGNLASSYDALTAAIEKSSLAKQRAALIEANKAAEQQLISEIEKRADKEFRKDHKGKADEQQGRDAYGVFYNELRKGVNGREALDAAVAAGGGWRSMIADDIHDGEIFGESLSEMVWRLEELRRANAAILADFDEKVGAVAKAAAEDAERAAAAAAAVADAGKGDEPKKVVKNKAYWAAEKKRLEGELAAFDSDAQGGAAWNKVKADLERALAELEKFEIKLDKGKKDKTEGKSKDELLKEFRDQLKQLTDADKQLQISLIEDETERQKEQLAHDWRSKLGQIEEERKKFLESKAAAGKGNELSVEESDMFERKQEQATEEYHAGLDAMAKAEADRAAEAAKLRAEEYEALLAQYEDFEQQKTAIAERYAKEREVAAENGASADLLQKIDDAERAATSELVLAQIEGKLGTALGDITKLTSWGLAEIEKQLAAGDFGETGALTPEDLARLKETLDNASNAIKQKDPFNNMLESLRKLKKEGSGAGLKGLEVAWGNFDEAVSATSQAFSALAGVIGQCAEATGNIELQNAAQIAGDVMQIADATAQGFAQGGIIGGATALLMNGIPKIIEWSENAAAAATDRKIARQETALNSLGAAYEALSEKVDKAFGEDRDRLIRGQVKNLKAQSDAYSELIRLEQNRKDSSGNDNADEEKIKEYRQAQKEANRELEAILDNLRDEVLATDARSAAHDLGNALIDAFGAGEDAARAWSDTVDGIVSNMVRNMLIKKFLEGPMAEIFNQFSEKWMSADGKIDYETMVATLPEFIENMDKLSEAFQYVMENLPDEMKEFLFPNGADAGSGLSGAIKGVSEETAGIISGQMNAIRMAQLESIELTRNQLSKLSEIAANTAYNRHLAEINDNLRILRQNSSNGRSQGLAL